MIGPVMEKSRKYRSVLRSSIALGTLSLLSFPTKTVFAQTSVTTVETTPVNTATGGAITISSGSITLTGNGNLGGGDGGAAVLLNSPVAANNSITNNGAITVNASNASGIFADTNLGAAGSITTAGSITVTDGTLLTSQVQISPGVYSLTTGSNRFGIDISGANPFVGTITQNSGDTITVRGNQSYGILVTPGITGNISLSGFLGITGVNSFGLQTLGPVNGDIDLLGTIHSTGQNSIAVSITAPVSGQLDIDGTVRSTGYYYAGQAVNARISQTAVTDTVLGVVYQLAPSVAVDGKIFGYNELQGGPAVSVLNNIGGGILVDTAGVVVSYGTSAGMVLGGTSGSSTTISGVTSTGTGDPSLLIRGLVKGNGIYDFMPATGLQVGDGGAVQLTGAVKVASAGEILGKSFAANATGILYSTGAAAPTLVNLGLIKANALLGYDGVTGGSATAVNDTVGTLTSITNQGTIVALASGAGTATALNLTANTAGVTVNQLASGTTTPSSITGNILFGSGTAALNLQSGSLSGNVDFGSGVGDTLTLTNGATMSGTLSASGGATPAVSVANGKLTLGAGSAPTLSSLNIGSSGEVIFAVNSATSPNATATVLGATVISSGGKIGLDVVAPLTSPETLALITSSGSLSGSAITSQSTTLTGDIPYFYVGNVTANQTTGAIMATLRDRTFAESGMVGTASAYNAIFAAANSDTQIRQTFDGAVTKQAFTRVYQQMLPAYSGGLFEVLSEGAGTVARAEADGALVSNAKDSGTWIQQIGFGAENGSSDQPGYRGGGLGFAFGWETPTSANSAIGISGSYLRASNSTSNAGPNNNQVGTVYSTGVYWRVVDSGLNINASLNAGFASFSAERDFSGVDATGTAFDRAAGASSSGALGNAHIGASYEIPIDAVYYFRPHASGDYFVLYQGSSTEHDGSNAFDLTVASSTGKQGSGEGGLTFGAKLGDKDFFWRPEMTVGYRQVFGGAANTVAQFAGGEAFTLSPASQQGGAIARIGVHGGNKFTDLAFEAGGEERGTYRSFDGRLVARFNF
jgi:hypothetical protein